MSGIAQQGTMIKLLSKDPQERVGHRVASAAPTEQPSEASVASAVFPGGSHQTLPQPRRTQRQEDT